MDPKEVLVRKRITTNLELYESFYDHEWARGLIESMPEGKLSDAVANLCVAWKEAANTHRLPWLIITQMEHFVTGYVKEHRPTGMRLIDVLKNRLKRELGDSVRHMAKKKIDEVLEKIDKDFRENEKHLDPALEPLKYWNGLVNEQEFILSICGSQSLSYCALIFAYEWFVVSCFRLLGGAEETRPSDKRFWQAFESLLSRDVKPDYWDDKQVKIARFARNSIAHTGGKAKQELLDENPSLFIHNGVITIQPTDTRDLFALLKGKVTLLVNEVLPKLVT
jgi:hypothetical protein